MIHTMTAVNMREHMDDELNSYPLRGTRAQLLLEAGIQDLQGRGRTQRELASALGYRSSVVLSHMATGRVPIPIDRANDIAELLNLDPRQFLLAVLEQRYPEIDFKTLFNVSFSSGRTVSQLEAIGGCALDELPADTKDVMGEIVNARNPRRRWLNAAEIPALELIRKLRPESPGRGLSHEDLAAIIEALEK